jgi:hypothetical protein
MSFGPKTTIKRWMVEPRPKVGERPILTSEQRRDFVAQALHQHCRNGQPSDTCMFLLIHSTDFPKHSSYDSRAMLLAVGLAQNDYVNAFRRQEEIVAAMHSRVDAYG